MTLPDVLAVVNAAAGTARLREVNAAAAALHSATARQHATTELVATESRADLDRTLQALDGRRLVILGGDGSIHAAVQCLHRQRGLRDAGPVGIVPLGTGNDLARTLQIPLDPEAAARNAVEGSARWMELLVSDTDDTTINAVHLGIGVSAASRGASVKRRLAALKLGKLGYPVGAVAAGVAESGWHLSVSVDGRVIHTGADPVLMVALGLGGTVGGGAQLIPDANPHDGRVDVVVWESVGVIARLGYALGLMDGKHARREDVRTARGTIIEVDAADGSSFQVNQDGEILGPFSHRRWEVHHEAWQAVVP